MELVEKIFFAFLGASLSASIVIGIVVVTLKLFNNHIGVRVKNILWLLVLIKLLIPIVPQTHINLFNILHAKNHVSIQSKSIKHDLNNTKASYISNKEYQWQQGLTNNKDVNVSNKSTIDNQNWISGVYKVISCLWITGIFIFALVFLLAEISAREKFKSIKNNSYSGLEQLTEDCRIKARIGIKIPVLVCDNFKSPCIVGIVKPKIYIPRNIVENDKDQLSYIILHEMVHYKRKDLLCNFFGIIALLMHWFNPVVWFAVNRMKIYREYACDSDVLNIIGEKETINYGMSIINISKIFSGQNKNSYMAVFFETKNQIKGRIEMIKNFKKNSHKISIAAALCCAMAATAVFTNGIKVNGMDDNSAQSANTSISNGSKNTFFIDSLVKHYNDINKAEKIAGFKFKVPGYLPTGYKEELDAEVVKLGENNNAFETMINFQTGQDKKRINYLNYKAFKGEPAVVMQQLKTIECINGHLINGKSGNANVKAHETPMSTKKLDGVDIDVTINYPSKSPKESFSQNEKYFAWKNDGIWYALQYKEALTSNGKTQDRFNIPISDIGDIATSIVYPEEQKNVKYADKEELSTELGIMDIYDNDDAKKAEDLLGFNIKFPLKVDNNIKVMDSNLGISGDSDVKNNKIYYELLTFYAFNGGSITFSQSKSPAEIKKYDDIKKNGYIDEEDFESKKSNKVKAEKLNIDNNDIMKYENSMYSGDINYTWKENGVVYIMTIFGKLDNADQAAKVFVMSNGIK